MNDHSSIVKTLAMQALADLAMRNEELCPLELQHIQALVVIGIPAMRARGKKLLDQFSGLAMHSTGTRRKRASPAHSAPVS
jgi:hypothetical protein